MTRDVSALAPASLVRRADGLTLQLNGPDAVLAGPECSTLSLPGESERMQWLWDALDAPCRVDVLREKLGGDDALLSNLLAAGLIRVWPLGARLAELHAATVRPRTQSAANAAAEEARLLRDFAGSGGCDLPPPALHADLARALISRRSGRALSGAPLTLAHVSALLAFGAGSPGGRHLPLIFGGPPGGRTYPSAGGLYPIEVLVRPTGIAELPRAQYSYAVLAHRLVATKAPALSPVTGRLFAENRIRGATLAMFLWADFTRESLGKYGEKAYRLALLEAGHIAQNVLLIAAALELGAVPLCGFDDAELALDAGLAYPEQAVVYAIAIGVP